MSLLIVINLSHKIKMKILVEIQQTEGSRYYTWKSFVLFLLFFLYIVPKTSQKVYEFKNCIYYIIPFIWNCKILKIIFVTENILVIVWQWGKELPNGAMVLLGVIDTFIILIVVLISWRHSYAKLYQALYFEYIWLISCWFSSLSTK